MAIKKHINNTTNKKKSENNNKTHELYSNEYIIYIAKRSIYVFIFDHLLYLVVMSLHKYVLR